MTIQDKIRGSLIGGAIGDALGYPVEFMSYAGIVHKFGERGITRYELDRKSGKALISDDTQMTLFTANGLLFGVTRWCTHGMLADLPSFVEYAYKEWYETQTGVQDYNAYHTCWIRDIKELNARRAPGNTCMSALESMMNGKKAVNDSKGCGGVMRVAPVGCFMASPQARSNSWAEHTVDKYAAECAAITHKHPLGYIPAAVLANIVYRILIADETVSKGELIQIVESAMTDARDVFTKENEVKAWAELLTLMNNAIRFAQSDVKDVDAVRQLGEGWTGDEALAIAVYCALKHTDSFVDAVIAAVNHSGDSDSTGAVCGNIMGAIVGYEAIPGYFKEDLELRQVILALADDMVHGCRISEYDSEYDNDGKKWEQRYVFAKPMLKPTYNSYAVNDWLYAGEYPGDKDVRKAQEKLDEFIAFGITHFIDLTEEGELCPYSQLLPSDSVCHRRFPIIDQSVPDSIEEVRKLIDETKQIHNENPEAKVYIHCWGGVGRTGTIVGCFLASELKADYETTIRELKRLWSDCPKSERRISPENDMQFDFIRRYVNQLKKVLL